MEFWHFDFAIGMRFWGDTRSVEYLANFHARTLDFPRRCSIPTGIPPGPGSSRYPGAVYPPKTEPTFLVLNLIHFQSKIAKKNFSQLFSE